MRKLVFDKTAWQREYRKRKRKDNEIKEDNEDKKINEDNENTEKWASMEEKEDNEENENLQNEDNEDKKNTQNEDKKTSKLKENIKPVRKVKNKKSSKIPLNPQGFAEFSVGIEKTTLNFHKDKILKPHEEQLIRSSAEQVAELYEVPKIIVVIEYIAGMVLPHATRLMTAQAEKQEIENEKNKVDLEQKKLKLEEARKMVKPEDVYTSVMKGDKNGN